MTFEDFQNLKEGDKVFCIYGISSNYDHNFSAGSELTKVNHYYDDITFKFFRNEINGVTGFMVKEDVDFIYH